MNIILFDDEIREQLLPLTFTRPVCELRVGILTIKEKWEKWMKAKVSYITQDYLAGKYPIDYGDENLVINGSALPSSQLCHLLGQMDFGEAYLEGEELIAAKLDARQFERLIHDKDIGELKGFDLGSTDYIKINHLWDIFNKNGEALKADFDLLTTGRTSQAISPTNRVLGGENIFIEEGAEVEFAILNAKDLPIYIGKNATILEGCMIRGGLAMGEGSVLKMGAKIYGPTTLGPHCKVGGEVKNVVFQAYSNKGHDGYLGNAVIGEWCNLGADTNCSNLKNNYADVKLWNYASSRFEQSHQQFCGLIMGDHSKCGINTMFNTGTVIGVSSNIFGSGFPRNFVPSFAWGGARGFTSYRNDKAFDTIERVMARKGKTFDVEERLILLRVYEETMKYRAWERQNVQSN